MQDARQEDGASETSPSEPAFCAMFEVTGLAETKASEGIASATGGHGGFDPQHATT